PSARLEQLAYPLQITVSQGWIESAEKSPLIDRVERVFAEVGREEIRLKDRLGAIVSDPFPGQLNGCFAEVDGDDIVTGIQESPPIMPGPASADQHTADRSLFAEKRAQVGWRSPKIPRCVSRAVALVPRNWFLAHKESLTKQRSFVICHCLFVIRDAAG